MGVQAGIRPGGTLAELAAEFRGWHVWRGRDGRGADQGWFATRRRRVAAAEAAAGLAATLSAGDAVSLHGMPGTASRAAIPADSDPRRHFPLSSPCLRIGPRRA